MNFDAFPKIPRLKNKVAISEKIDGTNAQVALLPIESERDHEQCVNDPFCLAIFNGEESGDSPLALYAGSRKRWIAPEGTEGLDKGCDNYTFALWVAENCEELRKLGEGRHFGEWFGQGIQRGYGLHEKKFALFNYVRWNPDNPNKPKCCEVVPAMPFDDPDEALEYLTKNGSMMVPGFMQSEGIIVFHPGSRQMYKKTIVYDQGKWAEEKKRLGI